jgi:hypothetical protein
MQTNKSDRNDAAGIARIIQCGWYKEVRVKGLYSHAVRALLESRALLVKMKRDLENPATARSRSTGCVRRLRQQCRRPHRSRRQAPGRCRHYRLASADHGGPHKLSSLHHALPNSPVGLTSSTMAAIR